MAKIQYMSQESFKDYLIGDLLVDLPKIQAKKMFGSYGLYYNGKMCGIINDEELYLKTNEESAKNFKEIECKPFTYNKRGKVAYLKNYILVPKRLLDDSETLIEWIKIASKVSASK